MAVDHENNLEVPIIYRVCFACGYNEPVDVVDEDTPAHNKYCPDCGSILHRLSGTEMFHLNFVDDPERIPSGIELVDDPKSQIKKLNYLSKQAPIVKVHTDDIVTLKAEGHEWTYVGKKIRPRFMTEWKKDHIRAIHYLQLNAHLAYWNDKRLPERRGMFGISKGKNLVDKILRGKPLTLKEIHGHQVSIKSDNHHILQIKIDDHILRFKPKKNFPLDNHLVSPTMFEDFVRRFKNLLREDSSRAVMFLVSQGKMVQSLPNKDKYNISVLPESLRNFNILARVFNKRGVFWRGNYETMHVKGSMKQIESIVGKIDSGLSVFIEETSTGDINPGYVVGKNKKGRSKSLKWMKKFLTGNVEEIDSDGEVTFEWRTRLTDKNLQVFKKALGILGATSARIKKDEVKHLFIAETHMTAIQLSVPRWKWVLESDEIDSEVGMHFPEDIDPELNSILTSLYGVIQDVPVYWAETFGYEEEEFSEALDTVLEAFIQEVATYETETGESITSENVLDILEDMKSWEKDAVSILKALPEVVGNTSEADLPFYVTFYILSDIFSAPLTEIEGMYFDYIESYEPALPREDESDVDKELDDKDTDVDKELDDNSDGDGKVTVDKDDDDDVTVTVQVDSRKKSIKESWEYYVVVPERKIGLPVNLTVLLSNDWDPSQIIMPQHIESVTLDYVTDGNLSDVPDEYISQSNSDFLVMNDKFIDEYIQEICSGIEEELERREIEDAMESKKRKRRMSKSQIRRLKEQRKQNKKKLIESLSQKDYLGNIGDVDWTEYGGELVFGGEYPELYIVKEPEMVYLDQYGDESEHGHREWKIYLIDLNQFHMQDGKLVNEYGHEDWFTDKETLQGIASTVGSSVEDMIQLLTSDNWMEIAHGYSNVAASYGWYEFDSSPFIFTFTEMKVEFKNIPGIEDISKE